MECLRTATVDSFLDTLPPECDVRVSPCEESGRLMCRSLVGRRFALGLLCQPDELRHDNGGIEHSEQRRE
jgi:hypothetical protein